MNKGIKNIAKILKTGTGKIIAEPTKLKPVIGGPIGYNVTMNVVVESSDDIAPTNVEYVLTREAVVDPSKWISVTKATFTLKNVSHISLRPKVDNNGGWYQWGSSERIPLSGNMKGTQGMGFELTSDSTINICFHKAS